MLIVSCTATVQHRRLNLAPQRCNMKPAVMHQNGATFATLQTDNLAPVGVQHCAPGTCTISVQGVMHHFGATQENRTYLRKYGQQIPSCTACKTVVLPYRNLTANHLEQTSRRRNQLTARAESEVGR